MSAAGMSNTIPQGYPLSALLPPAQQGGYAVGAFSARYLACIRPVLEAAQAMRSPVIVQLSQREQGWFQVSAHQFREEMERVVHDLHIDIPFGLHLDHSWETPVIADAITAGFTSVMIDLSALPFEENVAGTRAIVEYAHERGVSVEAELGRITTTDKLETESDEQLYTEPEEAAEFVHRTGCDALAVSVGTAHGVYPVKDPTIDFPRLKRIRELLPNTALVLHGGSGLPTATVHKAVALPGGGISKVNIATDLELALLDAMGGQKRMTSAELDALPAELKQKGLEAVREITAEKIRYFLLSAGRMNAF